MSEQATLHDGTFYLDRHSRRAAAVPIGPVRIGGELVMLRQPRWSDGPAWIRARRAGGERMRATFGESSMLSWAEYYLDLRRSVRAGLMVPFLALYSDGRVIGELNSRLDPTTGSAEISLWFAKGTPPPVSAWLGASALLRVYQLPAGVPRLIAPTASVNPGPHRLLTHWGLTEVGRSRQLREYDGQRVDHDIWWLERDGDHLTNLARGLIDPIV